MRRQCYQSGNYPLACSYSYLHQFKFYPVSILSQCHNLFICQQCIIHTLLTSIEVLHVSSNTFTFILSAYFGHYCHYLPLSMLSSITKININILSLVCPGNVQIVQDMLGYNNGIMNNDNCPPCLSEL